MKLTTKILLGLVLTQSTRCDYRECLELLDQARAEAQRDQHGGLQRVSQRDATGEAGSRVAGSAKILDIADAALVVPETDDLGHRRADQLRPDPGEGCAGNVGGDSQTIRPRGIPQPLQQRRIHRLEEILRGSRGIFGSLYVDTKFAELGFFTRNNKKTALFVKRFFYWCG